MSQERRQAEGAEFVAEDDRCPRSSPFSGRCRYDRGHDGACDWQNSSHALRALAARVAAQKENQKP